MPRNVQENPLTGQITGNKNKNLPPITVVNDFGNGLSPAECQLSIANVFDDHGVANGRRSPLVIIRDVKAYNIVDGAFHLHQVADTRRGRESVFVGVVDPGVGTARRGVVVQTDEGHSFVGPDNGLLSLGFGDQTITDAYAVRKDLFDAVAPTFHGRDVFAPLAAEIASGVDLSTIPALERIDPGDLIRLDLQDGHVVHHDGYPNAKLWQQGIPLGKDGKRATAVTVTPEQPIVDQAGVRRRHIRMPVVRTFEDVEVGDWLALEGSSGRNRNGGSGHLEIAIREGAGENGAATRLGTPVGGIVGLEWHFDGQVSGRRRT